MTVSPFSHGMRGYAGSILAGGLSAGLFAFAQTPEEAVLSFFASLSAIPLLVAGLSVGMWGTIIAAATATAALCGAKTAAIALTFIITYGLPSVGLTVLALRQYLSKDGRRIWCPEGDLLTAITLYPCVVFLALAAATAHTDGGLLALTTQRLLEEMELLKQTAEFQKLMAMQPDLYTNLVAFTRLAARALPAVIGGFWVFIMMFSGVVAQSAVTQQKWNIRTSFVLANIAVPSWLIFAAAAAGLMAVLAPTPYEYVGLNLAVILFMAFFLAGIAVVHAFAAVTSARLGILIAYYFFMILPYTAIILVTLTLLLGMVDQWADFRRRYIKQKRGG